MSVVAIRLGEKLKTDRVVVPESVNIGGSRDADRWEECSVDRMWDEVWKLAVAVSAGQTPRSTASD